jgi:hypothetical protein
MKNPTRHPGSNGSNLAIKDGVEILIDGKKVIATQGELLVEAILREKEIPHICYHSPLMGPIQTCDTCLVEVDGKLQRSCGTKVAAGMQVVAESERAKKARSEAFDVILGNHMLYCTVCDNNNENCRVHNTAMELNVQHQEHEFKPKPYEVDMSNPFYRYDSGQRDIVDRLGTRSSTRAVGRRDADWRIELRLVRTLHHGVPMQCADGEVHAGRSGIHERHAQNRTEQDDRRGQSR